LLSSLSGGLAAALVVFLLLVLLLLLVCVTTTMPRLYDFIFPADIWAVINIKYIFRTRYSRALFFDTEKR
jgi:hypothetical protein